MKSQLRFGVTKLQQGRHCSAIGCKKAATAVIGDIKHMYNLKNLFLCDDHLKEVFTALNTSLGDSMGDEGSKHQELIKDYLKTLYENNGIISKAKTAAVCSKHGIEVPEDSTMKKYMEIMFPEIKEGD